MTADFASLQDPSSAEKSFRQFLNDYSRNIPCHRMCNLGNAIDIAEVAEVFLHSVKGTVWLEQRKVLIRQEPSSQPVGGNAPRQEDVNGLDLWQLDAPEVQLLPNGVFTHLLSGLEGIEPCQACDSLGDLPCVTCAEIGSLICGTCDQKGLMNCPACQGGGTVMMQRTQQAQRRCTGGLLGSCSGGRAYGVMERMSNTHGSICKVCNGTGIEFYTYAENYPVTCTRCAGCGTVECATCNSTGIVVCDDCQGRGRIQCHTCQGNRHLRIYAELERTFLKKDFERLHLCCQSVDERLRELAQQFQTILDVHDLGQDLSVDIPPNAEYTEGVFRNEFKSLDPGETGNPRSVKRELQIIESRVWKITYLHNKNTYVGWMADSGNLIAENPITHELRNSLQSPNRKTMAMAYKMASKCRYCKNIIDEMKSRIPLASSFLGKVSSWFISGDNDISTGGNDPSKPRK